MANRSNIIITLVLLAFTILYGVVSVWSTLFPEKKAEVRKQSEQAGLVSIKQLRLENLKALEGYISVWGKEKEQESEATGDGPSSSGWTVMLDKDGWVLSRNGEERWIFSGVVQKGKENQAVFYNMDAGEKWRIINKEDYFDSLQLTSITHEKIHLSGPSGKEWVLGLFNLKTKDSDL